MSYRIEFGTPVESQLHAVFAEQIQLAIQGLREYPESDPDGLHSARKCLKRIRALLRLLRKKKFKQAQKNYNIRLRDIAVTMSPFRDREVIALLLSPFRDGGAVESITVRAIEPEFVESVVNDLTLLANTFERTVLPALAIKHLEKGMETCREIMLGAYRQYAITGTQVHLHELRKRVKDHTYHIELLADVSPQEEQYSTSISELEDLLGDARDCDLVLEYLDGSPDLPEEKTAEARVHFILTKDRIMKNAMLLCEDLFRGSKGKSHGSTL